MSGPETTPQQKPAMTLTQALKRAFETASGRLEQPLHETLSQAHAVVSHGGAWQDAEERWWAQRENEREPYHLVNGNCTCPAAATAVRGLCIHRLAIGLAKQAELLMAQGLPEPEAVLLETPPVPEDEEEDEDVASWEAIDTLVEASAAPEASASPLPQHHEAPASVNVFLDIQGYNVQLTLRDTDERRLEARLLAVLARYPRHPVEAQERAPADLPAPKPETRPASPPPDPQTRWGRYPCPPEIPEHTWCTKHGKKMPQRGKQGDIWWSHSLGIDKTGKEKFCRGDLGESRREETC